MGEVCRDVFAGGGTAYACLPGGERLDCVVATSFVSRLCGLLGTSPGYLRGRVLVLAPCSSIHTLGMAYAIDVAFVDGDGIVVKAVPGLPPGRVVSGKGAWAVLEREADDAPWVAEGDRIDLHGLHTN